VAAGPAVPAVTVAHSLAHFIHFPTDMSALEAYH
jgi:hypothetical protein